MEKCEAHLDRKASCSVESLFGFDISVNKVLLAGSALMLRLQPTGLSKKWTMVEFDKDLSMRRGLDSGANLLTLSYSLEPLRMDRLSSATRHERVCNTPIVTPVTTSHVRPDIRLSHPR